MGHFKSTEGPSRYFKKRRDSLQAQALNNDWTGSSKREQDAIKMRLHKY